MPNFEFYIVILLRSAEFILSIVEWARNKPDLRNLHDAIGELCGFSSDAIRRTQNAARRTLNFPKFRVAIIPKIPCNATKIGVFTQNCPWYGDLKPAG